MEKVARDLATGTVLGRLTVICLLGLGLTVCAVFAVAQLDAHAQMGNDARALKNVPAPKKKDPPPPPPTLGISLNPLVGPPTTAVAVSGTKFGRTEAVDVYFDNTDLLLAVTNASGSFSQSLDVPTSAQPGTHWVTAIGRVSGLAAQSSFLVQTNWAQFRYNLPHSGFNPFENTLDPGNVAGLNQAWAALTGGIIYSSPAVANGVVYVGSEDDKLYAFNAVTGAPLTGWPVSNAGFYDIDSSPAVANGVVYVASNNAMYALNAVTGAVLSGWPAGTFGVIESSAAVANGVVYVDDYDGNLYAFNAVTGAVLSGWPVGTSGPIFSSPAVANGVVYVGNYSGNLYAFNAVTGVKLWSFTTGEIYYSSPAVANGVVYVGSQDNNLYAFNAVTGAFLWGAATGGEIDSSPAVANGTVYVGSDDNNLYAYNLEAGLMPDAISMAAAREATAKAPDPSTLIPDYSLRPKP